MTEPARARCANYVLDPIGRDFPGRQIGVTDFSCFSMFQGSRDRHDVRFTMI